VYLQSMRRNFNQYETARVFTPRDHSVAAMTELAKTLLAS